MKKCDMKTDSLYIPHHFTEVFDSCVWLAGYVMECILCLNQATTNTTAKKDTNYTLFVDCMEFLVRRLIDLLNTKFPKL